MSKRTFTPIIVTVSTSQVKGPLPPVALKAKLPSPDPKQVSSVIVSAMVKSAGLLTSTESIVEHPKASETTTLYKPAERPKALSTD